MQAQLNQNQEKFKTSCPRLSGRQTLNIKIKKAKTCQTVASELKHSE